MVLVNGLFGFIMKDNNSTPQIKSQYHEFTAPPSLAIDTSLLERNCAGFSSELLDDIAIILEDYVNLAGGDNLNILDLLQARVVRQAKILLSDLKDLQRLPVFTSAHGIDEFVNPSIFAWLTQVSQFFSWLGNTAAVACINRILAYEAIYEVITCLTARPGRLQSAAVLATITDFFDPPILEQMLQQVNLNSENYQRFISAALNDVSEVVPDLLYDFDYLGALKDIKGCGS